MDTSGIATAVFRDHDGSAWVIAANRFVPGNSWGTPQSISTTPSTTGIGDVDVAASPAGEAVVVWTQQPDPSTNRSTWGNAWTPGTGWGTPIIVDNTAASVLWPSIALDASGAGTAVWLEPGSILRARAYVPGGNWGTVFTIPGVTTIVRPSVIAAQANGRTYVAWSQTVGSGFSLFASWSDGQPPSPWHTELVDTLSPPAEDPDVAVTASGTAFLVWRQAVNAGEPARIWARRRPDSNALGAWEPPLPLSPVNGGHADAPRVAVDDAGNAIAVWEQQDALGGVRSVWTSLYLEGAVGWQAAQLLETAGVDARFARIAMTPGGEAVAVWLQREGGGHWRVWAAHFVPGSGWGAPVRVENDVGKEAFSPAVAVDNSGNAFAVWELSDPAASGVSKVWASQYR